MKPTLLVLAAGMGSRYGGLKQLDGVGPHNETILEYSVYDAIRAGFGKAVFVIRADFADDFKTQVAAKFADRIPVEYVFQSLDMVPAGFQVPPERQKPWGTGHAILMARDAIQAPFAAINADDFYGATAYQLLADFLQQTDDLKASAYAMVGYILRNTLSAHGSVARGVCQQADDYLQSIVELTKIEKDGDAAKYTDEAGDSHPLSGDEIVSLNIWGFTPSIFDHLDRLFRRFLKERGHEIKSELYIPTAVGDLITEGLANVQILPSHEPWFGVTYREDKPTVIDNIRKLVEQQLYPENLWSSL
jgi:UTP-glucose-1-phosphate uridylyltransferase